MSRSAEQQAPKGSGVFLYHVTIEVERVDPEGQLEDSALEGAPRPVLTKRYDGTVRAPAKAGRGAQAREVAAGRALHAAGQKLAAEKPSR